MKGFQFAAVAAVLLTVTGSTMAETIVHTVTPQNTEKQFYAFKVEVKDADKLKDFRVTVQKRTGREGPSPTAIGSVHTRQVKSAPYITREVSGGVQAYSFQLAPTDLEGAHFVFTEGAQDVRASFVQPHEVWELNLIDFVAAPKK